MSQIDAISDRSSVYDAVTRMRDLVGSGLCLVVFSPVLLAIALAVKVEDGGDVFFTQERVGRGGRAFKIFKFRSMRMGAESEGEPRLSSDTSDDDRLTRVGRFLRAHHLDELPQFLNVFLGDMGFIGYRPERSYFINQIMEQDKRYERLFAMRPGLTSYATLYNGYTDTMEKMLRRLKYDLYYLDHRGWGMDFRLLVKTFFKVVSGK